MESHESVGTEPRNSHQSSGLYLGDYRKYLFHSYEQKREKNPRYSMRAFARDLGVEPSRLSEILLNKVGVSKDKAEQIGQRLGLMGTELGHFVDLVDSEHARSEIERQIARKRAETRREFLRELPNDADELISQWYHFAILEYLKIPKIHPTPENIAQSFSLTLETVQEALQRLERLQVIENENGIYKATTHNRTTHDVPSQAVRSGNSQLLDKAKEALFKRPVQERDITAVIMKFNRSQIPTIKARLREFRRDLMMELENDPNGDAVGCLALSFFQLDGEEK